MLIRDGEQETGLVVVLISGLDRRMFRFLRISEGKLCFLKVKVLALNVIQILDEHSSHSCPQKSGFSDDKTRGHNSVMTFTEVL